MRRWGTGRITERGKVTPRDSDAENCSSRSLAAAAAAAAAWRDNYTQSPSCNIKAGETQVQGDCARRQRIEFLRSSRYKQRHAGAS